MGNYSINPASGYYNDISWYRDPKVVGIPDNQQQKFAIPGSLSNGKEGFEQQTFLGASIRSLSCSAGYGDSSSTMNIELVNDEYNKSDGKGLGVGHDVYHNGKHDQFSPPPIGAPVFFQFGKTRATVDDAFAKMYDDLYGYTVHQTTINKQKAQFHFNFGGILQSYVQNRGSNGNPLYSVQIVDPREILSNTTIILNNYTGTTYNNKNMFNLYGFLEYNPTQELRDALDKYYPVKDPLRKVVNPANGSYDYLGKDLYAKDVSLLANEYFTVKDYEYNLTDMQGNPAIFPITGTGFARRCNQGMPYYRIKQSLEALLGLNGNLPPEYVSAGFGGYINFRGFNYIVDLSGLEKVGDYYFFDFDQMNLLDFCLEICDITSSDLFVSLLPIIQHPVCQRFYAWNEAQMFAKRPDKIIAGIIRVDSISRAFQPEYGAIKNYIDRLASNQIYVENQDVGFELSNVTTDKFVVGAQEVDMYFFSANADRDNLEHRKRKNGGDSIMQNLLKNQWTLETSYSQQILPYYGLLGNGAVTIPKGFGSYQQILLDASSLNANGVGNYYVATEMELRCALISYERWAEFIFSYDSLYMESMEEEDAIEGGAIQGTPNIPGVPPPNPNLSNNYAVTVPRCVFHNPTNRYGSDELPVDACHPPYGYPLYYKRATRIGAQGAGLTGLSSSYNGIITSTATIAGAQDDEQFEELLEEEWNKYKKIPSWKLTVVEQEYLKILEKAISGVISKAETIGLIRRHASKMSEGVKQIGKLAKKTKENALKVYNFIKRIADECLGKKFLVKLPREANVFYDTKITITGDDANVAEYATGPFGFRPRSINFDPYYEQSPQFKALISSERSRSVQGSLRSNMMESFLTPVEPNPKKVKGGLEINFNPLTDEYETNYLPSKQGGYVNFDLFANIANQKLNPAISQALIPVDLTNFINDGNRLSSFVRFDHSESLDFSSASSDDFSQQAITANGFIPDLSESLDNNDPDKFNGFPKANELSGEDKKTPSVAFMRCEVDEKVYMPPQTSYQELPVHGTETKDIGEYSTPSKIWVAQKCKEFDSFRYYKAHIVPKPGVGGYANRLDFNKLPDGTIITKKEYLDTNHVYALITLPSRVVATYDSRFRDGPFQLRNAEKLKHYMCMDVVRLPEFEKPAYRGNTTLSGRKPSFSASALGNAVIAYNKAMSAVDSVYPNAINILFPSPVYPDLVALPLLSNERCYGPWVSSHLDSQAKVYDNIPGKIDFIKDENLAPWNFNGYDLMNAAGVLQAKFSNSLLLQSERGGFVLPEAPSGVALGRFLANLGPLVTNISIDISDSIKTTYKMDLYTSQFGKLQKQKSDMISNISRERQKLKDERNALIRKGIGKNQTNVNYNLIYKQIERAGFSDSQVGVYQSFQSPPPNDTTVLHSEPFSEETHAVEPGKNMAGGGPATSNTTVVTGSTQNGAAIGQSLGNQTDRNAANSYYYNTASASVNEEKTPASMEPGHPNMAYVPPVNPDSFDSMLLGISEEEEAAGVSVWDNID